mgnify:CR=1 FL=1
MTKRVFRPGTMLNPVPAVMVSCGNGSRHNIITIAWTGIINSDPPMTYISVKKERYSHDLIKESGESHDGKTCFRDRLLWSEVRT